MAMSYGNIDHVKCTTRGSLNGGDVLSCVAYSPIHISDCNGKDSKEHQKSGYFLTTERCFRCSCAEYMCAFVLI